MELIKRYKKLKKNTIRFSKKSLSYKSLFLHNGPESKKLQEGRIY